MTVSGVESNGLGALQELFEFLRQEKDKGVEGEGFLSSMEGKMPPPPDMEGKGVLSDEQKQKLLVEFDADGDGELSEEELQVMRDKMQQMHAMFSKMQQNMGPGGAGDTEEEDDPLSALMGALQSSSKSEEIDADGDGAISEQELADYLGVSVETLEAMGQGDPGKGPGKGEQDKAEGDPRSRAMRLAAMAYAQGYEDGAAAVENGWGGSSVGNSAMLDAVA